MPWRFLDACQLSLPLDPRHCRRPKTCTIPDIRPIKLEPRRRGAAGSGRLPGGPLEQAPLQRRDDEVRHFRLADVAFSTGEGIPGGDVTIPGAPTQPPKIELGNSGITVSIENLLPKARRHFRMSQDRFWAIVWESSKDFFVPS